MARAKRLIVARRTIIQRSIGIPDESVTNGGCYHHTEGLLRFQIALRPNSRGLQISQVGAGITEAAPDGFFAGLAFTLGSSTSSVRDSIEGMVWMADWSGGMLNLV